jgi:hypothetical protein
MASASCQSTSGSRRSAAPFGLEIGRSNARDLCLFRRCRRTHCAWRGLFTLGAKGTQMTPSGRHQVPGRFYQTSVCDLDCKARPRNVHYQDDAARPCRPTGRRLGINLAVAARAWPMEVLLSRHVSRVPQLQGSIRGPCSLIQTTQICQRHGQTLVVDQLSLPGRSSRSGHRRCSESWNRPADRCRRGREARRA